MTRRAFHAPFPGLLAICVLLPLMGFLLVAQAMSSGLVWWVLFAVVAFTIFVVGVVTAASALREKGVATADAARLDELEPLPPAAGEEGDRQ